MVSKVVSIRLDISIIRIMDRLCKLLNISRSVLIKEFIRSLITVIAESGEKPDDVVYQVCIVNRDKIRYCVSMHFPYMVGDKKWLMN